MININFICNTEDESLEFMKKIHEALGGNNFNNMITINKGDIENRFYITIGDANTIKDLNLEIEKDAISRINFISLYED